MEGRVFGLHLNPPQVKGQVPNFVIFRISDFAAMLSAKLGIKTGALQKTLWGDFYLHSKTKRIFKGAQAKSKKPLFVQFVLENLWAVYDAVMVRR